MMLGLDIPTLASRTALGPVPPLPPPTSLTNVVIQGDSLTGASVVGQDSGSWAWQYLALKPAGTTLPIRAQGSRYTGELLMLDDGSNTLFGHLTADATTHGGQLIWAGPFLTNDFGTSFHGPAGVTRAANIKARLAEYRAQLRAKGANFALGFAPPLRADTNPADVADWYATRTAFIADFRDPAVWSLYCDFYLPIGEQPDFNAADNSALIGSDRVHPTTAGQAKLLEANRPALDTLFDGARIHSNRMYDSAWPSGATGLGLATQVTRRFVVSGLAHKGLALTGANALSASGGAQLRVNGGAWTAASGWLYNGDTVELRVTTSASADTPLATDLRVGTETRTLTFRTAKASAAVEYLHGDVAGIAPQSSTHAYPARAFAAGGVAVIGLVARRGATGVTVGGVPAVRRATQVGVYGELTLEVWTTPLAGAGPQGVLVAFAAGQNKSAISWGVITGADAAPALVSVDAVDGPDPHATDSLSVPVNGLALGYFGEYGGAAITPATLVAGTAVDEGSVTFQGESFGLAIGKRANTGAFSWTFGYGPYPIAALVFTPA